MILTENPEKIFRAVRKIEFSLATWKTQQILKVSDPVEQLDFIEKVAQITVETAKDELFLAEFNLQFSKATPARVTAS